MIYEAINEENLEFYDEFIPGPYKHFALFPGEIIIGAVAEEEDLKYAQTNDPDLKQAEDGEVIPAGVLLFNIFDRQTLNIDWIFVDEPFREQGIATTFLRAAFDMAGDGEFRFIRARAFDEYAESFLIRRGFSEQTTKHLEWFMPLNDAGSIEVAATGESYQTCSLRKLSNDVAGAVIDRIAGDDICFPLIPRLIDPDHSFVCLKDNKIVGSLLAEYVSDVYCLTALRGDEEAKRVLVARYLKSFKSMNEESYLHVRSFSDDNDSIFSEFITKTDSMSYQVLIAYPNSLHNAEKAVEKAMLQEEEAQKADENFPKSLVVTGVEYYSGMIIDEEDEENNLPQE